MNAGGESAIERVYVWQMPVRIAHWAIVFSIVALSATGLYIAHPFISAPGEASKHFVMGWMRTVHLGASIVFGVATLLRIVWMFMGAEEARWDQLVPTTKQRWRGLFRVMRFYALPRDSLQRLSQYVQAQAERTGEEVSTQSIIELFRAHFEGAAEL